MPGILLAGLGLQYFMKLSGGLCVPIAIHFVHNVVNGIVYGAAWKRRAAELARLTPGAA